MLQRPSGVAPPAIALLLLLATAGTAAAAEPAAGSAATVSRPALDRPHAVYLELLGKGGLWGAGYDVALRPWLAVGAVASFYVLDEQRVSSFSPYVAAYPLGAGRHRWFVQLGPQLVHVATPSPVPEWTGTSSTGVGAELSSGYEYRNRVLVRLYATASAGEHGVAPWLGLSLGWTL